MGAPRPRRRLVARLRLKKPEGAASVHDARATRGLRAFPQRLLAMSLRAKACRHHVVQLAGARRPAAHSAHLPFCAAGLLSLRRTGHFPPRLEQLQKNLVRQAGAGASRYFCSSALHHLRGTSCSSGSSSAPAADGQLPGHAERSWKRTSSCAGASPPPFQVPVARSGC